MQPQRAESLAREDQAGGRAGLRDLLDRDEREQRPRARAAPLLVEEQPEEVVLAEELDDVPRELVRCGRSRPRAARRARARARARDRGPRVAPPSAHPRAPSARAIVRQDHGASASARSCRAPPRSSRSSASPTASSASRRSATGRRQVRALPVVTRSRVDSSGLSAARDRRGRPCGAAHRRRRCMRSTSSRSRRSRRTS